MTQRIEIPPYIVRVARESQWGGDDKMGYYSESDQKENYKVLLDRFRGNLGEMGSYLFLKKEFDVAQPNLTTDGNYGKWGDDVRFFRRIILVRNAHEIEPNVIIKTQAACMALCCGLSWTFQLKAGYRPGDPASTQPLDKAFIGVHLFEPVDLNSDTGWSCDLHLFYYPDVFPYLANPVLAKYVDKKKVIYYKDVKGSEIDISELKQL